MNVSSYEVTSEQGLKKLGSRFEFPRSHKIPAKCTRYLKTRLDLRVPWPVEGHINLRVLSSSMGCIDLIPLNSLSVPAF